MNNETNHLLQKLLQVLLKNKKLSYILGIFFALVIIIVAALSVPQEGYADLSSYYGISEGETAVFLNDAPADLPVIKDNGAYYLPLSYVQSTMNKRFYWDEETQGVLYALPEKLVTFLPEEVNGSESVAPLIWRDDTYYLSLETISRYTEMSWKSFESPDRLWIETVFMKEGTNVRTEEEVSVHTTPHKFSKLVTKIQSGESATILQRNGDWLYVRTNDGHIGYISSKNVEEVMVERQLPERVISQNYYGPVFDGKISLGFDYMDNPDYCMDILNAHLSDRIAGQLKVNILTPTWFVLHGSDGSFSSCGDPEYVKLAHENGLQVWVMIENITGGCDTETLLHFKSNREALIENLLSEIEALGADGINLDFESMTPELVTDYLEFIRELKQECLRKNIVLSADTYAPFPWNEKYDLPELSEILDYVIIMGYDESWDTPGPNSEKKFIEFTCEESLKSVPKERLIIGVPIYTRGWYRDENGLVRSEVTMKRSEELMSLCTDLEWQEEVGCYHGNVEDNGIMKEIWFEDLQSSEERLRIISGFEVKGIAAWRLNEEDPGVWNLVEKYILEE